MDLKSYRIAAAEASAGSSSEAIHDAIVRAVKAANGGGTALDFGCGNGRLAHRLASSGYCTAVEAADLIRYDGFPDAIPLFQCDLNSPSALPTSRYDLIVASEVIEHLENPRHISREWFRLLRPGGIIVASTPNNESWRSILSLVMRGHFVAFTGSAYPAHITALLRADLLRVFSEAGFEDVKFSFSNHGGIPGKPAVTWQSVTFGLLRGLRFSDNVVCIARKPMAAP
jgi:2-polyprenyl-3-methyl-5-hydroxy-6-metoxy-1,4-benzoquinol methylase